MQHIEANVSHSCLIHLYQNQNCSIAFLHILKNFFLKGGIVMNERFIFLNFKYIMGYIKPGIIQPNNP
jgi:hypothetical protein